MSVKLALGAVLLVLSPVLLGACFFGGGNDPVTASRPESIPTATIPANLPAPILITDQPSTTGSSGTPTPGGSAGAYVVKTGDTIGAIAASLNVPPDQLATWTAEVLRINGIADARLLAVGQELRLPASTAARPTGTVTTGATATPTRPAATTTPGAAATATATRPPGQATPAATTPAGATGRTYTVVAGDNPNVIGQKLNVPGDRLAAWADELMTLNSTTPSALQIGQVLRLPASTP